MAKTDKINILGYKFKISTVILFLLAIILIYNNQGGQLQRTIIENQTFAQITTTTIGTTTIGTTTEDTTTEATTVVTTSSVKTTIASSSCTNGDGDLGHYEEYEQVSACIDDFGSYFDGCRDGWLVEQMCTDNACRGYDISCKVAFEDKGDYFCRTGQCIQYDHLHWAAERCVTEFGHQRGVTDSVALPYTCQEFSTNFCNMYGWLIGYRHEPDPEHLTDICCFTCSG